MNRTPVITVIGAASITFGPKMLRDIINYDGMEGCEFRFVDIHGEHLEIYSDLVKLITRESGRTITVKSSVDRNEMLPGSDYVIISVETNHHDLWEEDFKLPVSLGSKQVTGELGGPGGLFHTLRQIPLHLEIGKDIETHCPGAMVMIMSNPLNRLCLAMARHTSIGNIVGLCHGVEITENFLLKQVLGSKGDNLQTTAAGTNHFTWILDMINGTDGTDLYPEFKDGLCNYDPKRAPLTRKMYEVFGYVPACGDGHFGEYLPYAWEFVGMEGPPFNIRRENEEGRWDYFRKLVADGICAPGGVTEKTDDEELMLKDLNGPRSWVDTLVIPIINAVVTGRQTRMAAVNLLNHGSITNLPNEVFVETPAIVDAKGIHPEKIGILPQELAAFNRRDIDQMELAVAAGVTGNRNLALQAMMLDPVTDSLKNAEKILDAMLKQQEEYLPQFA